MMKKFNWKKYIYKIVVVVLIVFFVGGVGIGAANILSIEGTYELYTPEEGLSPIPESEEQVVAYINAAVDKALATNPLTTMRESFSIDTDSVKNSAENEQLNAAVILAADEIESAVEDSFETKEAAYGESAVEFLSDLNINPADVEEYTVDYKYFKCSMCESHIAPEDYAEECPECGNQGTLNERYGDEYSISIKIKPDSATASESIFPKTEKLASIISDAGEGYYTAGNTERTATDCLVYAKINRLTDEIKELRFEMTSDFDTPIVLQGAYADIGSVNVTASATDKYSYSFTWAGISLDKHETTIELGSSEVLKATLICDNPVGYSAKWSSDNEDVLTVDEEGYLKTHKKFGDANITAEYEFNGVTYKDTCLVHVGVPVEGVDLNKGKLKLSEGESFQLVAEFDPKDSTNTKCYWFTNDESVAKIDENGVITAVGTGSTKVFVVTDYGNFYSSCEVEVTN